MNVNAKCFTCGKTGHVAKECRRDKKTAAGPQPQFGQGRGAAAKCYTCGCAGHIARDCRQGAARSTSGPTDRRAQPPQRQAGAATGKGNMFNG
eukprot:11899617-Heterocapsa_arctica.AAC.1